MKLLRLIIICIGVLFFVNAQCGAQFGIKPKIKIPDIKGPEKKEVEKKAEQPKVNAPVDEAYDKFLNEMGAIAKKLNWEADKMAQTDRVELAKKLNLPETIKRIEKEGNGSNNISQANAKQVLGFNDYKLKYYGGKFKTEINTAIEEAYKLKGEGKIFKAIMTAKSAVNDVEYGIALLPGNSDISSLKNDAEKSFIDLSGPYYQNIWSSDFHKQNAGKFLFSKQPIIIGKEDPNQFTNSFTANDRIYGVVYLDARVADYIGFYDGWIRIDIDKKCVDVDYGCWNVFTDLGDSAAGVNAYYVTEILPDPAVSVRVNDGQGWVKEFEKLSPRSHNIDVYFYNKGPSVVKGTINLDLTGFSPEKMRADADLALKNSKDNIARNTPVPDVFKKPSKGFKDKLLSIDKMKKIIQEYLDPGEVILKVIMTEDYNDEWSVRKNEYGITTHRVSQSYVSVLVKDKDNWCYFMTDLYFEEKWEGNKFGNPLPVTNWKWTKCNCGDYKYF